MNRLGFIGILIILIGSGCDQDYSPRPIGQMRIAFPDHVYEEADQSCPYSIEIPVYSRIDERGSPEGSCWSNLVFPEQRATIHLTYRELNDDLPRMLEETHKLTFEHHVMADNIEDEQLIFLDKRVFGTVYTVSGNVASNVQFYLTDSSKHFIRGSLYFNAPPNKDSLAPVVEHLKKDVDHMLKSLRWSD